MTTATAMTGVRPTTLSERVAMEIKVMLLRRGMSGRLLAERLGVSSAWVSYRLSGKQEIGVNDLERIAEVLGVEIADLLLPKVRITRKYREPSSRYRRGTKRPRTGGPNGHPRGNGMSEDPGKVRPISPAPIRRPRLVDIPASMPPLLAVA